jgi:hypothetical protein
MTQKVGETALDAVNAALEEVVHEAPVDTSSEATGDDSSAEVDEAAGTDPDIDGTDGDEGATDGDGEGEGAEGDEAAAGRERDPATGKFLPKSADKPGEKPADKPAEGVKPVEPKKPDPINDPIPKDLKGPTQERIRSLISTTKEVSAERDQIKQDFDYMVQGVQATGASPEQYGETLSWLAMFNSNDPKQQEKALELVETVAERLATLLGKERTVGDPLSTHADLKEAVRTGKVTIDYAKEIARTRNGQQFRGEINNNARQEQERQQAYDTELATARTALTDLEGSLKSLDKDWDVKKPILVAALKPVFASIPPSQWKAKFEEAYRNLPAMNRPAVARPRVPENQPMRAGKNPAGGGSIKSGPSSALEAVNAALAGMGGK